MPIMDRVERGGLKIDPVIDVFVKEELTQDTKLSADEFWDCFASIIEKLSTKNKSLLEKRSNLQSAIEEWHKDRRGETFDKEQYKSFLYDIGYLVEEGGDFQVETQNLDPEITSIPGPQLVVPATNARFALNAANARWGSLYDALYGTDVIDEEGGKEKSNKYNETRGEAVVGYTNKFLDEIIPLDGKSHSDVDKYAVIDEKLDADGTYLIDSNQFAGYLGEEANPTSLLFKNNGLHIELQIDREDSVGKSSSSGVKDVILESAVTTILDLEDSVATVDGEDKVGAYRNLLGLFKGNLTATFEKGSKNVTRKLNTDLNFKAPSGKDLVLPGLSLLLVRNVGHLMTNPAVLDQSGQEVPEGIMDALFTGLICMHDTKHRNSPAGSIYVVKPKMHGPEEVAFTCELFTAVEEALELPKDTIKLGIMDEERRTTVNLKECIRVAKTRVVFINTGFLDRTGDEIHTSMEAGPFLPKNDIRGAVWISAYEDWNVDIGLETGLDGNGQIGKGMWAMPDEMLQMVNTKMNHPESGASTAWVPSPTAATLHAIHYHGVDVLSHQVTIKNRKRASLDDILQIPLLEGQNLSEDQIKNELENNCQGILGYVVRWIQQGVGCSKVPDINNVGLMEDRATLRISSQHIANWLYHGICSEDQVLQTMKRMAKIVDEQNQGDADYIPMSDSFEENIAFGAACDLVFKGHLQPSGYTEPILHEKRLLFKKSNT